MRAYAAYSRSAGIEEGAILVIHHTARKAKALAWRSGECLNVSEFTDLAVMWINNDPNIMKLSRNYPFHGLIPHITSEPVGCIACGRWGCGLADYDGEIKCAECGEYPGDELIKALSRD